MINSNLPVIFYLIIGDDQAKHGYFDALGIWISTVENYFCKNLSPQLVSQLSIPIPLDTEQPSVYNIQFLDYVEKRAIKNPCVFTDMMFEATVQENIRLTKLDWSQDVRHIKLQLPNHIPLPKYAAGDIAEVTFKI